MKKFIFSMLLSSSFFAAFAQPATSLYQTARTYMMHGDFENAAINYNTLLKQDPNNADALADYCYLLVLQKDYAKAIELGKQLIASPKANVQVYQTLGLAYKGKAAYKEAEALYKAGLVKFASSGVLYNEYGELFAMQNKLSDAILQWETGIKADPNYSNNYYNATMYYSKVQIDLFWVIQYGEIFINLDSYSAHTATIKVKLLDAYKKILAGDQLDKLAANPANSDFQKAWYQTISLSKSAVKNSIDAESLGALRTRFILDWFYSKQNEKTPFHLFDNNQYLVKEGFFDAYNQWIFGEAASPEAYQGWANTHDKELNFFKAFQQNKIYRQPAGEYYK
ncbi:tetratricopeptide repeat protein [Parasediminibacterium sp. JCM 36343]|uniref:tetratricopeptide repeat protein n=1 Tax=Parasediminibacterium sp. JCM 36343 TaxID=3374279 RepID=UPI00397D25AE